MRVSRVLATIGQKVNIHAQDGIILMNIMITNMGQSVKRQSHISILEKCTVAL